MDLTIPLKGSTAGPQYAGWQPRTLATQGLGNRELGGSVCLRATTSRWTRTSKTPGRYPAVVAFAADSSETA